MLFTKKLHTNTSDYAGEALVLFLYHRDVKGFCNIAADYLHVCRQPVE